jgi:hypothetical protein
MKQPTELLLIILLILTVGCSSSHYTLIKVTADKSPVLEKKAGGAPVIEVLAKDTYLTAKSMPTTIPCYRPTSWKTRKKRLPIIVTNPSAMGNMNLSN